MNNLVPNAFKARRWAAYGCGGFYDIWHKSGFLDLGGAWIGSAFHD